MEKVRKFEVAKGFEDKGINLPVRKTKYSAGYDIEAAEDVIVPSFKKGMNPTLVKTGIKALNKSKIIHSIPKGIPQYLITFPEPGFISSDIFLISMPLTNLGIK